VWSSPSILILPVVGQAEPLPLYTPTSTYYAAIRTELCTREECSVRQANMTILLAFRLATNLVKAAVEGRLPRGTGVERLRDLPTEWSQQFELLGLSRE
jgi:hypothetical protein